ncbi:MAG: hypothetical protein VKN33_11185 [Candidatus Sericytochromatia bacterium]|nr:hypothetical protein [Candidatus Sericytochromatia bacterium]
MAQVTRQTSLVQSAIAHYDDLLRESALTQADYNAFQQRVIGAKITFGGRSSCPYMRPQFISAQQWDHVQAVSKRVNEAMEKAASVIQADATIRDLLRLTPEEERLIAPDPGYPWLTPTCRYDSFISDHHYAYVELNAECPAGPAFTTVLANLWLEEPVMKRFQERFNVETFDVRVPLLQMLVDVYSHWRGNGHTDRREKPQIAIVDYLDVPTLEEFYLCRDYFRAQGYAVEVADPRDLRFENGRLLTKEGFEIDLVYRRLLTNEFLERFDQLHAFWDAYRTGAACVVNPFRSKLLHKKSIFAVVTDERVMAGFTPEEREAVKSAVPWTRLVQPGHTQTFSGETIDLLPWILDNQQNLVLKPNDEYGGKGIYIGWTSTPDEWRAALDEAQRSPYVVQWKVEAPQVTFPVWGEAGLVWEPQTIDIDPYMFFGEAHGFLTRLSTTALCNVTAGGGIVPTFVVSEK